MPCFWQVISCFLGNFLGFCMASWRRALHQAQQWPREQQHKPGVSRKLWNFMKVTPSAWPAWREVSLNHGWQVMWKPGKPVSSCSCKSAWNASPKWLVEKTTRSDDWSPFCNPGRDRDPPWGWVSGTSNNGVRFPVLRCWFHLVPGFPTNREMNHRLCDYHKSSTKHRKIDMQYADMPLDQRLRWETSCSWVVKVDVEKVISLSCFFFETHLTETYVTWVTSFEILMFFSISLDLWMPTTSHFFFLANLPWLCMFQRDM